MNRFSLKIGAAAAALALAAPAAATNGMRMIGFGPVQNSMGGASVAAPLDATTVVTNPAGMSALDRRFDISGTAFMPTVKYSATGAASGAELESERPVDYIPTLATIYRVQDKLTVGVAALGVAGMGVDYDPDLFMSGTKTSYMNARLAPAVAYKVTDRLSVGAAGNLMYAQMLYNVAGAMGMPERETDGVFGVGGTVGVTFKAHEQATLAVAYESKSYFQSFEFDVPAHSLVVGFDGGGNPIVVPIPGGTESLDFDQPDVLTVGGAFRPLDPLLVAIDVQWINWDRTNGQDLPAFDSDTMVTGARAWNLNWSEQWVFKIGAQYELSKALRVRAGYNYGASPLDSERAFENVAFPAISEHHFSVGAGYDVGTFTVNAALQYSPEATLTGSNASQGIASYETTLSQLVFDLGATWRF
jgi:long-chain fatty acid transport protein